MTTVIIFHDYFQTASQFFVILFQLFGICMLLLNFGALDIFPAVSSILHTVSSTRHIAIATPSLFLKQN